MPDNINIKDSGGTVVPVSTVETTNLNGVTTPPVEVQRLRVGYGTGPTHSDVDATHPLPVTDAGGEASLAAILAKLADPATQTTLAAVLAKLTADPSTGTNQAAQSTKLDALHTDLGHLTDGSLVLKPSAATAFADTGTISAATYRGIAIKNTSTTATAEVAIRQTNVGGTVLDTITLAANESVRESYPSGRSSGGTIYMQLVSGTVSGSVFSS